MPRSLSRPNPRRKSVRRIARNRDPVKEAEKKLLRHARDNWLPHLTPKQNLERLGLASTSMLNGAELLAAAVAAGRTKRRAEEEGEEEEEEEEEVKAFVPPSTTPRWQRLRLPSHVVEYIDALVETYGDDYARMQRDIRLNNLQWTSAKCRSMIHRLIYLMVTLL